MRSENVLFLVQARLRATRLPEKVLKPLGQRSLLANVLFGLPPARTLVVIPEGETALREEAERLGYQSFEGPERDVMKRYELAVENRTEPILARITADNPCWLRTAVDEMIDIMARIQADYAVPTGLPLGLGFELFTRESFLKMCQGRRTPQMMEHVTPGYYLDNAPYKRAALEYPAWESVRELRLTVDTPEDLRMMQALAKVSGTEPCRLLRTDFVRMVNEHPEVLAINSEIVQKSVHEVQS